MAAVQESPTTVRPELEKQLEEHRAELTGYCYRMLGSPFEAEDAVQETFIRAWRGFERFEGRAALRSWLYRIATNVCLDMLSGRERRARPMDHDPARVRRGAAAPAAAAARRPDPLRGAALEGRRGGRAPRDQRRVGEQRAAAGAGDAG